MLLLQRAEGQPIVDFNNVHSNERTIHSDEHVQRLTIVIINVSNYLSL